jgi:nitroimidazol reductase NimA-like FMN-containing flavoprotein (pyridoxamine 5'-phosphate oxidase superfamily)
MPSHPTASARRASITCGFSTLGCGSGLSEELEREMRRSDKEITDPELIAEIIRGCLVCRLGLAKDNNPYIVPVSFGHDGSAIYFHTAKAGKKIDYIQANNAVCFELERGVHLLPDSGNPCNWTFSFQSVVGNGRIHELVTRDEKAYGLDQIMQHYSGGQWEFDDKILDNVRVWSIAIEALSGKQSKDKAMT